MNRVVLALLFGLALPATLWAESPRSVNLEFKLAAWYVPQVDDEFPKGVHPYHDVYGDGSLLLFQMRGDHIFYSGVFGTVGAGGGFGYGQKTGHGFLTDKTRSTDDTTLHLLPLEGGLLYQYDYLATRWSIPVVPYGRADLAYAFWWITNGVGDTAAHVVNGEKEASGKGGTWGFRLASGGKLLLDVFAPSMARTFDVDFGVNNSYILVEYVWSRLDDFGSASSIRLGGGYVNFGLAFEF